MASAQELVHVGTYGKDIILRGNINAYPSHDDLVVANQHIKLNRAWSYLKIQKAKEEIKKKMVDFKKGKKVKPYITQKITEKQLQKKYIDGTPLAKNFNYRNSTRGELVAYAKARVKLIRILSEFEINRLKREANFKMFPHMKPKIKKGKKKQKK